MEKVKVLQDIPGLLYEGDILISKEEGEDFKLDFEKTEQGFHQERHVTLDYMSVCGNIPTYFTWVFDEPEEEKESYKIVRSEKEIEDRMQFYRDNVGPNSGYEKNLVFNNLIWLLEWLTGRAELLK